MVRAAGDRARRRPLDQLGPEAATVDAAELAARFAAHPMRIHRFLRDQRCIAGLGRRLANEVCHRAKLSPFAMTRKLGARRAPTAVVAAIHEVQSTRASPTSAAAPT